MVNDIRLTRSTREQYTFIAYELIASDSYNIVYDIPHERRDVIIIRSRNSPIYVCFDMPLYAYSREQLDDNDQSNET